MSKSKSKQTYQPKPFESTGSHFTNPTTNKIQADTSANIYESMLLHPSYQPLKFRQQSLYTVCKAQYYGKRKPSKDYPDVENFAEPTCFYLNWEAVQRYGLYKPSMHSNFYNDMNALIEAGFIDRVASGTACNKTVYKLSDRWWTKDL